MMGFLARLLPYWRWIVGFLGVLTLIGSMIGTVMYVKHLWVEAEIMQRSYDQAIQQLEAVTKELEHEQARREQENQRVDKAEKEAAEIDDASDPAAESTRTLLNSLYN